jgi:hypothetical protein
VFLSDFSLSSPSHINLNDFIKQQLQEQNHKTSARSFNTKLETDTLQSPSYVKDFPTERVAAEPEEAGAEVNQN